MERWIVGGVVLPGAPDDLGPGASEDAFGVGMSFPVSAELAVAVGGPFVAVARAAGECDGAPLMGPLVMGGSGVFRTSIGQRTRRGVRPPRLLRGRQVLYSFLQSSMTTRTSVRDPNSVMFNSSSSMRPLNDSTQGFSQGDPGSM